MKSVKLEKPVAYVEASAFVLPCEAGEREAKCGIFGPSMYKKHNS